MLYLVGLAFAYLALADPKSCTNSQNCASGDNCLDVNMNGSPTEVCTKCEPNNVPINGACQLCGEGHYLYSGGCYAACPQGTPNPETNTCDGVPTPDCNLPNCKSCPDGTCTECNDGFVPSNGSECVSSSVNKSELSTGAIAGIAVAVIVVVGGLVGFLCWWFLCRGKA
ncbi:VSP [Giardia duodenalis]|uniref:VSP n=1 Tax=Giardia intestinalis (strain ATCC 50803 / WB clone C6) TaxID=184922 RepID=A8B4Y3_GIAIC|nr:VSP [Giardia intestinalis]KAE8303800.1 VSP [Giardia intestinalis]|eukprot:XP_001709727.1 VSP [Giardia lamblia ATCC 50803]